MQFNFAASLNPPSEEMVLTMSALQMNRYKVFYWAKSEDGKHSVRDGENYIRSRVTGRADIRRVHSVTDFDGKQLVCYDLESALGLDELSRLVKLRVEPQERVSALLGSGT